MSQGAREPETRCGTVRILPVDSVGDENALLKRLSRDTSGFDSHSRYNEEALVRDKVKYNTYLNEYMKNRWRLRRATAISSLGGCCVVCGTTESLEFDHVDPETKIMSIGKASSRSEEFFWAEVNKCQLLCTEHHKEKTKLGNAATIRGWL